MGKNGINLNRSGSYKLGKMFSDIILEYQKKKKKKKKKLVGGGKRIIFRNRNRWFKLLVVNCRILNTILNFEHQIELVNSDMNVGLHSFVGSGIDLWNSLSITTCDYSPLAPIIKSIINFLTS